MIWVAKESHVASAMRRQQFSELLKLSPQAIVVLDADSMIREWNPATVDLLGWSRADALGRPLHDLVPTADQAGMKRFWAELRISKHPGAMLSSHLRQDGAELAVEAYMAPIQDVDGTFAGAVATISRQHQSDNDQQASGAITAVTVGAALVEPAGPELSTILSPLELDDVTGLPGRRWLQRRLEAPVPAGQERAVGVLDVDAFALVNQEYGPEAGDTVLRELAERLVRVCGTVALGRWQADEFVCVVDAIDATALLTVAIESMAPAAREPFLLVDDVVRLTISAGLASSAMVPAPALFKSASAAMSAAKAKGRNCTVWFDHAMAPAVRGTGLRMANDLHRGLGQGEMRLHFQPIVDLATNDVEGVEALVRWKRPGVGLLAPGAFIDLAERTGQIVALGEWIINEACRSAVSLEAAMITPLRVSINVSARQLSDPGFVDLLEQALAASGCPPANIAIEVTETSLVRDMGAATAVLEAIKTLGVELDLDDFGTGYSSLVYLRNFPVDRIKIDQSFVAGLGASASDTAIVASTIALAHSVGLVAIAEGVETAQQLTMLRQMGCDFAQGYLLCRPLPAEELLPWLREQLPTRLVPRSTTPDVAPALSKVDLDSEADAQNFSSSGRGDDAARRPDTGDIGSAGGPDPKPPEVARDQSAVERDHVSDLRDQAGDRRDRAGDRRDRAGDQRDDVADQRDLLADERDKKANQRDDAGALQRRDLRHPANATDVATRDDLLQSAVARDEASADRVLAAQDRVTSASDRLQAERDRDSAFEDRGAEADRHRAATMDRSTARADIEAPAADGLQSSVDVLTGAYVRDAGLAALTQQMAAANRDGQALTLAYVTVDGEADSRKPGGQIVADALMVLVVNALGACLRETDLLVRGGPGHFLCALRGLGAEAAAECFASLDMELSGPPRLATVTIGYAEMLVAESAERLIERAVSATR